MKNYEVEVKLEWVNSLEAKSKKDAIKKVKESFKEDYKLDIKDGEIFAVKEIKK